MAHAPKGLERQFVEELERLFRRLNGLLSTGNVDGAKTYLRRGYPKLLEKLNRLKLSREGHRVKA